MEHYVIIGNGGCGIEAALTIRERLEPSRARITVISKETDYFYSRTALMYAFMNTLERRDMEPYERDFYPKQSIELVRDEVVGLDDTTRTLTLRDGEALRYDKLLLAVGATPRKVPFKGLERVKDGVVNFVSMQDLDACERLAKQHDQAVVVGGGLIGIELAESLHFHGLSTTFLVREDSYWPAALSKPEGDMVSHHIRHEGVDLRLEEEIEEIFCDDQGKLTHVTTSKGNEIPCQILGLCIGVVSNNAWLKQVATPPKIDRSICVDRGFKTSLEHVWAAGDCIQMDVGEERPLVETIWYSAKRHGRLAALAMMGDHVQYVQPLFYNSSKFFELEYTTVGKVVHLDEGDYSEYKKMPDQELTTRVVYNARDEVIGFNMIGSRWNHRLFERWILERRDPTFIQENLQLAQFDVEFGRAKLERMQTQEHP